MRIILCNNINYYVRNIIINRDYRNKIYNFITNNEIETVASYTFLMIILIIH